MQTKKSRGLSFFNFLMLTADLLLAFYIGRAVLAQSGTLAADARDTVPVSAAVPDRNDRPGISDFSGWYYANASVYGMPDGYENIDSREEAYGSWKATFYRHDDGIEEESFRLLNIDISGDFDNITANLDWYSDYSVKSKKEADETSKKDTVLTGGWKAGAIAVSGDDSELTIPYLWRMDGKEYGMGTGTIDGARVGVALVRDR